MFQPFPVLGPPIQHFIPCAQALRRPAVDQEVEVRRLMGMQAHHVHGHAGQRRRCQDACRAPRPRPPRRGQQTAQAANRQQAQRRVEEVHLPPAVVEVGVQRHDGRGRQRQAGEQQPLEAQPGVAQHVAGAGGALPYDRGGAGEGQQEGRRRRGDRHPRGQVLGWNRRPAHDLALKEGGRVSRMPSQRLERVDDGERVAPEPGGDGVARPRGGQHEGGRGDQRAAAPGPVAGLQQVQRPQPRNRREQRQPHDAQVDQHADARAAQRERRRGVPAEGALHQPQRDHEHRQERDVLGIEERVPVQPGMEQVEQQGEQGQPSVGEHPVRQQPAEEPAGEEEQVGQQVAEEMDGAAVGEAQQTLRQEQRRFERDAVVPVVAQVVSIGQWTVTQHVAGRLDPPAARRGLVIRHSVVVEDGHADRREHRQHDQRRRGRRAARRREAGRRPPPPREERTRPRRSPAVRIMGRGEPGHGEILY